MLEVQSWTGQSTLHTDLISESRSVLVQRPQIPYVGLSCQSWLTLRDSTRALRSCIVIVNVVGKCIALAEGIMPKDRRVTDLTLGSRGCFCSASPDSNSSQLNAGSVVGKCIAFAADYGKRRGFTDLSWKVELLLVSVSRFLMLDELAPSITASRLNAGSVVPEYRRASASHVSVSNTAMVGIVGLLRTRLTESLGATGRGPVQNNQRPNASRQGANQSQSLDRC